MNSKRERVDLAIINIEGGLKYLLEEIENKYYLQKIPKNEYIKLLKNFKDIDDILAKLKKTSITYNQKLAEIKMINLTLMALYDEGDYNTISTEIFRANNEICKDSRENDKRLINRFKQIINNLTNYYQYRIRKAEINSKNELKYRDKVDNVKCIIELYLTIKYSIKNTKYKPKEIKEEYQIQISEYTKIINSTEDEEIKKYYTAIRDYLIAYAKAETIIENLNIIIQVCNENKYSNVAEVVKTILNKYQKRYNDNKEQYDILTNETKENTISKPKHNK